MIKSMIKQNLIKLGVTGLVGAMLVAGASACDTLNVNEPATDVSGNVVTDAKGNTVYETNAEDNTTNEQFEHSQLYYDTQIKWLRYWNSPTGQSWDIPSTKIGFQSYPLPYRFLYQQGIMYYDEEGYAYAIGNEDYKWNDCLTSNAYIDPSTEDCDIYLLLQYKDNKIKNDSTNNGVSVTTWMLKYTVEEDVYRDFLLLHNDHRSNLLFQAIDETYTPEVISKAVIDYELIKKLNVFEEDERFPIIYQGHNGPTNYIESIDYDTMTLTINYSPCEEGSKKNNKYNLEHAGEIYTYKVSLKDTEAWDKALVGQQGIVSSINPMTREERDSLTLVELMPTRDTITGKCLSGFKVGYFLGEPTDQQLASATLKYNFVPFNLGRGANKQNVNDYDAGRIDYEDVNDLTKQYMNSKDYNN